MWNGALDPRFVKHRDYQHGSFLEHIQAYGKRARFVRLSEMTAHDWDILDYDEIRNVARNRISAMVASGELIGFLRIEAHTSNGKEAYYLPVTRPDVNDFVNAGKVNFSQSKEVDFISSAAELIENARDTLSLIPRWVISSILQSLRVVLPMLNTTVSQDIVEQVEEIGDSRTDELDAEDVILLLVILLILLMGPADAIDLIDGIPEEVGSEDELLSWLMGRVEALQSEGQQLAAGRGLDSPERMV